MSQPLTLRHKIITMAATLSRKRIGQVALLSAILLLHSCDQETPGLALPSLAEVGSVSVVCLAQDERGDYTVGRPAEECPDAEHSDGDPDQRRLFSLATQPKTGEIAVVDLAPNAESQVVDFEPTQPGFSFLPVGAQPDVIVSTPGGIASFATTLEVGREGIFALPSSCIQARPDSSPARDLRSWSACQLPSAPGPMQLLFDPSVEGQLRETCASPYLDAAELVGRAPASERDICPADLSREKGGRGRHKLAVALPDISEVWILDAQALLDRTPGTFEGCTPEVRLKLTDRSLPQSQNLPVELQASDNSCAIVPFDNAAPPFSTRPYPVDFALDDRGRLYIADTATPLIHVLDASHPCQLQTLPPLQPLSLLEPSAVITTRRVAASSLTPLGKRFVYAVDNSTTVTAGTLIPFDVSPGTSDPTPLIRERAIHSPQLPPDRITLNGRVSDVHIVFLDDPNALLSTGSAQGVSVKVEGIECQPNPEQFSLATPEAGYREGARPSRLRGTFAFAAMQDGQMRVIDIEDLDALCRRPIASNPEGQEDIAGCSQDPELPNDTFIATLSAGSVGVAAANVSTVSNELSCHVVTPHWPRASRRFAKDNGIAVLSAFPSLTLETGRAVATDQSEEGVNLPKMLAARHRPNEEAVLSVGANDYITGANSAQPLDLDPGTSTRNSLLLSYESPRELVGEAFSAVYEGVVRAPDESHFLMDDTGERGLIPGGVNALYCRSGLQDMAAARLKGQSLGVSEDSLDQFARQHADYVQVIGTLTERSNDYWQTDTGSQCGSDLFQLDAQDTSAGYSLCEQFFGPATLPGRERDLRIVEAWETQLIVEPRSFDPRTDSPRRRRETLEFLGCCFPEPTFYQARVGKQWLVRGDLSASPHPMITDPETLRCVADCSPLKQKLESRVFELSCGDQCRVNAAGLTAVGVAETGVDTACIVDSFDDGIDPDEPGAQCVFQSLTTRFAIYRGQQPSTRSMSFRWNVPRGFSTISTDIGRGLSFSSPLSLFPISRPNRFLIPDATALGLTVYRTESFDTTSIL